MNAAIAIARRELLSYFGTAVGYVVIAMFLLVSGLFFAATALYAGAEASLRPFFDLSFFLLVFIAPAISMRLLSEEARQGTLETLMTCPVSDAQIVIGKWLGALAFFVIMLIPTLIYPMILMVYSSPDIGSILTGYIGIIAIGALYIASGTLASSVWPSQIVSYLAVVFFWMVLVGITTWLARYVPDPWSHILFWLSVEMRYSNDFAKGVLDSSTIIYFASATFIFLVASVKVLESKRWR